MLVLAVIVAAITLVGYPQPIGRRNEMSERILIPLDGSQTAAMALNHAEALAASLVRTLVRVVHFLGELTRTAAPSLATQAATSQDLVTRSESAAEYAESQFYVGGGGTLEEHEVITMRSAFPCGP